MKKKIIKTIQKKQLNNSKINKNNIKKQINRTLN